MGIWVLKNIRLEISDENEGPRHTEDPQPGSRTFRRRLDHMESTTTDQVTQIAQNSCSCDSLSAVDGC